ncbi:MAG: hypothetical protein AB2794_07785 [Candidatus Thiodiazotropha endolucinida]
MTTIPCRKPLANREKPYGGPVSPPIKGSQPISTGITQGLFRRNSQDCHSD